MASSIQEILYEIRHAIYGKDVRENIAEGIEKCYEDVVEGQVLTSDIVDALDSTEATKVLSANQGRVLNEKITGDYIPKTDIVDALNSTDPTKVLSAKQGRLINLNIENNYVPKTDIVNNLSSSDATKALSANQGRVLNNKMVNDYVPKTDIVDNLGSSDSTKTLSANQGKVLEKKIAELGSSVETYVPVTSMAAQDGWFSYPVDIRANAVYPVSLSIKSADQGGYYLYALYNNDMLVWGSEEESVWVAAGQTVKISVTSGIAADTFKIRNRNGRTGASFKLTGDAIKTISFNLQTATTHISDMIAEPYDSTKIYPCGSYTRVDMDLYRNWFAITTPEEFTSWKWTKIAELDKIVIPMENALFNRDIPWIRGGFTFAEGTYTASANSICTVPIVGVEEIIGGDYYFAVFVWKDGTYIGTYHDDGIIYKPTETINLLQHAYLGNYDDSYMFRVVQYSVTTPISRHNTIEIRKKRYEMSGDHHSFETKSLYDGIVKFRSSNVPNTITIASGSTGYNSYFMYTFHKANLEGLLDENENCVAVIVLKPTNYTVNPLKEILMVGPSGENYTGGFVGKLYELSDGTIAYAMNFKRPNLTTGSFSLTFQVKNETPLTQEATIVPVEGYLILEKYTKFITNSASTIPRKTVITVGTGKQYTSLRTALEYAATIASKTNHVTVQYYGDGVEYDVMNDITEADLTTSSTFIGLVVPAYCKLLGMGSREQNKISLTLPEGTDSDVAFRISTVNLIENAELENVWFYGKRCRYACHDDTQTYDPEWTLKTIRNCKFTSDFTNQHRSYGAGYRSGVNWRFENCLFENINGEGTQHGNAAFSAHNNNGMRKSANITFVNCQAVGGHAFGFESLNRTSGQTYPNAKTMISFYGCKATTQMWDRPIQTSIPAADAALEVCVTGYGNNFDNGGVAVYCGGQYYNDRFADQLTLWGKITEST